MKEQFTSLEIIEILFGGVFPCSDRPENTISIFKPDGYREACFGRIGIFEDAVGYLHTEKPIDATKIRGIITGISHDHPAPSFPNRKERVLQASAW